MLVTFSNWVAAVLSQLYCWSFCDRVPLWLCRRYGYGLWKPEYRLHVLWVPIVTMPIGLGLFGACLQYRLHYMALAFASFLINFSAVAACPPILNYLVDCFTAVPNEVTAVVNLYRLILGLVVPFFVSSWIRAVGVGWVFGMMALFCVFASAAILLLGFWGHQIRDMSVVRKSDSEEGTRVVSE